MAKSTKVRSTEVRNLLVSIPYIFATFLPHYLSPIFETSFSITMEHMGIPYKH